MAGNCTKARRVGVLSCVDRRLHRLPVMKSLVFVGIVLLSTMAPSARASAGGDTEPTSIEAKKGMGVSCKRNADCATNFCKPNKAHLPGYVGTCQRR